MASMRAPFSSVLHISLALALFTACTDTHRNERTAAKQTDPTPLPKAAIDAPPFEIVHVLDNARFDHAPRLFVLTTALDLSSPAFKKDVQNIIRKVVQAQGARVSIDIFDDKATLERKYQRARGFPAVPSKSQVQRDSLHFIAGFDGLLTTEAPWNTLYFFPGAFKDTPKIGKYVEYAVEFNP